MISNNLKSSKIVNWSHWFSELNETVSSKTKNNSERIKNYVFVTERINGLMQSIGCYCDIDNKFYLSHIPYLNTHFKPCEGMLTIEYVNGLIDKFIIGKNSIDKLE